VGTQQESTAVPTRPLELGPWLGDVPRHFAGNGDLMLSHILTVLSSTFPEGEAYFVRSVSAVRDRITDPRLRQEVEGFIGQEAMHGREHAVFNERMAELGYPVRPIGAYVRKLTWLRERFFNEKVNLAVTAALEHYTATLAETMLGEPEARDAIGHDGARYLLLWHALEEAEHKAVAFDVYRHVGGTERMRIVTMWVIHLNFVLETSIWTAISLGLDPAARRHPVRVLRSLWRLRHSGFISLRALRHLRHYHRHGFHPNDYDSSELISTWRAKLFGSEGALTEVLVT
jgi:predicted metal-dependent hydrolase